MPDPITTLTASMIATLAFHKFIEGSAGELAKKFTINAIAKMEQLRELIWSRLTGEHPAADNAIEQAKAGEQVGIDTVVRSLGMLKDHLSEFINILFTWRSSHVYFNFVQSPNTEIVR
jgi:hypothetical protein